METNKKISTAVLKKTIIINLTFILEIIIFYTTLQITHDLKFAEFLVVSPIVLYLILGFIMQWLSAGLLIACALGGVMYSWPTILVLGIISRVIGTDITIILQTIKISLPIIGATIGVGCGLTEETIINKKNFSLNVVSSIFYYGLMVLFFSTGLYLTTKDSPRTGLTIVIITSLISFLLMGLDIILQFLSEKSLFVQKINNFVTRNQTI